VKRIFSITTCLILVCGVVGYGMIPVAQAATCNNKSLRGSFGFQEQGQFIGGGFEEFRSIGIFKFDGNGKGTRQSTIWYSDFQVSLEPPYPISYEVQHDCSFTLSYSDSSEEFAGVIVQNGQKLLYLEITGDPMRSGQAERMKTQKSHGNAGDD
jgi:hypothetical protein